MVERESTMKDELLPSKKSSMHDLLHFGSKKELDQWVDGQLQKVVEKGLASGLDMQSCRIAVELRMQDLISSDELAIFFYAIQNQHLWKYKVKIIRLMAQKFGLLVINQFCFIVIEMYAGRGTFLERECGCF